MSNVKEKILNGLQEIINKYQGEETDILEREVVAGTDEYIKITDEVKKYFELLKIQYKLKFWRSFDSCGADCYCLAVSWIYQGEIELYTVDLWLY